MKREQMAECLEIWTYNLEAPSLEGEILPHKRDEGSWKISRTPLKGTRILFYGYVPNSVPALRGTNSTATNYITGTANFNRIK